MTKVLVVSRSLKFSRILDYSLSHYGFDIQVANDITKARRLMEEIKFSLILLDLPFTEEFFGLGSFPCRVLAMGDTYEEICILERIYSGIDDYILKPFGMAELRVAMNKQLERGQLMQNPLIVGELKVDLAKNIVVVKDKIISLGRKELEVMIRLARKAGRYVTADALVTRERISALKRKIELEAGSVLEIKYINGLGYKLIATAI